MIAFQENLQRTWYDLRIANRIQQMQVVQSFKRRSIFSLEPMVESFMPRMVFALISMSLSILDNSRRTYRHFIEGQLEDNHDGRKTVL